jgi:hypothetical protein
MPLLLMHSNPCLTCLVKAPKARIEDWGRIGDVIVGTTYDVTDPTFREGGHIRTSRIVNLDQDAGHVETLNSNYVLGKERL